MNFDLESKLKKAIKKLYLISLFLVSNLNNFIINFAMNKKERENKMKSETFKPIFCKQKENILYKTDNHSSTIFSSSLAKFEF
jgi:hypothetical protein